MKRAIFRLAAIFWATILLAGVLYAAGYALEKKVGGLSRDDIWLGYSFMFDEKIGWVGKKNFRGEVPHLSFPRKIFDSINAGGYRDGDWDEKIEDARVRGAKKVLVMGDSFVFGTGSEQDQTVPAMAQKYADAIGLKIKFFNAGIPAYGFMHYRREMDFLIDRIRPDEVWLVVCANDWGDSAMPYDHRNVARVYKPFYDEKGVLESAKVKQRPSLFLGQEFHIKPNRFTLVWDHASYLFEDMLFFLRGIPTRWTTPLPIQKFDNFGMDPDANKKFPKVKARVQKVMEDMAAILKQRNIRFRMIPIDSWQAKKVQDFSWIPGIDVVVLPEIFDAIFARPWGQNFNESHRNFIWACFLARFMIDRVFVSPRVSDPEKFKALIQKELKSSMDLREPNSWIRNAFGRDWDPERTPIEPKKGTRGYFALSNPFGEQALVVLTFQSENSMVSKLLRLPDLVLFKERGFTLGCVDHSESGVLFFWLEGSGLVSARVVPPDGSESLRVS